MTDWLLVVLGILIAGASAWAGWVSFTLSRIDRATAHMQGVQEGIEHRLNKLESA